MDHIEINLLDLNEKKSVERGITLGKVIDELKDTLPYMPLGALVNNVVLPFDTPLITPCDIRFITIQSEDGLRIYLRTLSLILSTAVHNVLPSFPI